MLVTAVPAANEAGRACKNTAHTLHAAFIYANRARKWPPSLSCRSSQRRLELALRWFLQDLHHGLLLRTMTSCSIRRLCCRRFLQDLHHGLLLRTTTSCSIRCRCCRCCICTFPFHSDGYNPAAVGAFVPSHGTRTQEVIRGVAFEVTLVLEVPWAVSPG